MGGSLQCAYLTYSTLNGKELKEIEKMFDNAVYRKFNKCEINHWKLCQTTETYKDYDLIKYSCMPLTSTVKNFKPIVIDDEIKKLNKLTGEVTDYTRLEFENNIRRSKARSQQKLRQILWSNNFDWFLTLTFSPDVVDRTNSNEVIKLYEKYINNIKHQCPNIYYVCVPEGHKKDNAVHFHLLVGGVTSEDLGLIDSGYVTYSKGYKKQCSLKKWENTIKYYDDLKETDGNTIYNISTFKYGFTTAGKIINMDKTRFYVMKYLTKNFSAPEMFSKRYYASRNLKRPKVTTKIKVERTEYINVSTLADIEYPNSLLISDFYRNNERNIVIKKVLKVEVDLSKLHCHKMTFRHKKDFFARLRCLEYEKNAKLINIQRQAKQDVGDWFN